MKDKLKSTVENKYLSFMLWLARISRSQHIADYIERYTAKRINVVKMQIQKDNWNLAMLKKEYQMKEQHRQQTPDDI